MIQLWFRADGGVGSGRRSVDLKLLYVWRDKADVLNYCTRLFGPDSGVDHGDYIEVKSGSASGFAVFFFPLISQAGVSARNLGASMIDGLINDKANSQTR